MQFELISDAEERTFAAIFATGEEVMGGLIGLARDHNIKTAHFTAIGAFSSGVLGYFDWEQKDYLKLPFTEQLEVLSFSGDLTLGPQQQPWVHAHAVLGARDGSVRGGHVLSAIVRPTLEVIISDTPKALQRHYDPATRLALIDGRCH